MEFYTSPLSGSRKIVSGPVALSMSTKQLPRGPLNSMSSLLSPPVDVSGITISPDACTEETHVGGTKGNTEQQHLLFQNVQRTLSPISKFKKTNGNKTNSTASTSN